MSRERGVRRAVASPIGDPVSTLAIILAAILAWRSVIALSDLDLAARLLRLSEWLDPRWHGWSLVPSVPPAVWPRPRSFRAGLDESRPSRS